MWCLLRFLWLRVQWKKRISFYAASWNCVFSFWKKRKKNLRSLFNCIEPKRIIRKDELGTPRGVSDLFNCSCQMGERTLDTQVYPWQKPWRRKKFLFRVFESEFVFLFEQGKFKRVGPIQDCNQMNLCRVIEKPGQCEGKREKWGIVTKKANKETFMTDADTWPM